MRSERKRASEAAARFAFMVGYKVMSGPSKESPFSLRRACHKAYSGILPGTPE
jgi:hypothetical protein